MPRQFGDRVELRTSSVCPLSYVEEKRLVQVRNQKVRPTSPSAFMEAAVASGIEPTEKTLIAAQGRRGKARARSAIAEAAFMKEHWLPDNAERAAEAEERARYQAAWAAYQQAFGGPFPLLLMPSMDATTAAYMEAVVASGVEPTANEILAAQGIEPLPPGALYSPAPFETGDGAVSRSFAAPSNCKFAVWSRTSPASQSSVRQAWSTGWPVLPRTGPPGRWAPTHGPCRRRVR